MKNLLTNYDLIVYKSERNKYATQNNYYFMAIQFIYTVFI